MSSTGNCFDNAAMESFFHTLKTQQIYFERYFTLERGKADIFEYVEVFYHNNNDAIQRWTIWHQQNMSVVRQLY